VCCRIAIAASCAAKGALGPVGLLSAKAVKAQAPSTLEGAAVAIGYVQGCAGDFYSYNELMGPVEDVHKVRLSLIRVFKCMNISNYGY